LAFVAKGPTLVLDQDATEVPEKGAMVALGIPIVRNGGMEIVRARDMDM